MGELLSSRSVIGRFYQQLEIARAGSWVPQVAFHVDSDQAAEELPFLSAVPAMKEWIGGRVSKGFVETSIRVPNRHFEATIDFRVADVRRDKTSQINMRIGELADRAASHPKSLLSALLNAGESSLCYDGQYFFDTDHVERESGIQSNIVEHDIAASYVPMVQQGTPSSPSAWTLAEAIARAVQHFPTLRDDVGEPIHQAEEMRFLVMVPVNFLPATRGLSVEKFASDVVNILRALPHRVSVETNPRLTWTNQFVVLRTDAKVKPFIHQVETEVSAKAKAEGSEYEFDYAAHQYGIDQWSAAEFGFWQYACLCKLV